MPLEGNLAHCGKGFERSDRCAGTTAPGGIVPSQLCTPSPSLLAVGGLSR